MRNDDGLLSSLICQGCNFAQLAYIGYRPTREENSLQSTELADYSQYTTSIKLMFLHSNN